MPSFSKPKSVRVQHTLDQYYNKLATCTGFANAPANMDGRVGLFNDSQIGEYLFVYDIQAIFLDTTYGYYYSIFGSLTTQYSIAFPVVCDGPTPRGITFTDIVAEQLFPPSLPFATISNIGAVGPIRGPGPLAIVKQGYSLVVQSQQQVVVTFRYLVMGP
jgi:hypothetical protein